MMCDNVFEWTKALNDFLKRGLDDHWKRPLWDADRVSRGGEALMALQNRSAMWGRSIISNCYGDGGCIITKSALKTYTEALEHDLRNRAGNDGEDRVSAHLLIPGWTKPEGDDHPDGAWFPEQVTSLMWESMGRGDFYILCPDNEVTTEMDHKRIRWGAEDIAENRPPLSRWHPSYKDAADEACS